nr:putative ring finger protein c2f3.16 [Quercus suber]
MHGSSAQSHARDDRGRSADLTLRGDDEDGRDVASPTTPEHLDPSWGEAGALEVLVAPGDYVPAERSRAHFRAHDPPQLRPVLTGSARSILDLSELRMSVNPGHGLVEALDAAPAITSNLDNGREGTPRVRHTVQHRMSNMDGSLPDDDGMQALRRKLQDIRTLAISTEEKAARMHRLMTMDYLAHKPDEASSSGLAPEQEGLHEMVSGMTSSSAPPVNPSNPYNIHTFDLEPVFSPLAVPGPDASMKVDENREDEIPAILGCMHYKRNVKVQCFDCHLWFPCRHCHDQSERLPFPHALKRKKTQHMLCMLCCTPQPAAEICIRCGEYAAWYYCAKCKLWDNDSNKRIYHCDDCGICRVGEGLGKDYIHCKRCNVCISISTSAAHPCVERATEGSCPLCLIELFESRTRVVSLPCGHYMHGDCYKDLMAVTYKCPVCSKSAVNMELQWRKLDDEIRLQPMPEDDADLERLLPEADTTVGPVQSAVVHQAEQPRRPRTVWIGCNDCGGRCWTPFHWLGLKCQSCDSYNTSQMAPTAFHETEAERVVRQQLQHHRQHDFTGDEVLRDAGISVHDIALPETINRPLDAPSSPSYLPVGDTLRASGAQSPTGNSRRYFVQEELPRRSSFTAPRFPTPNLPQLPDMPRMPRMPNMPNIPNMPNMPNMPNLELARFSPYGMINAVSRSLSPMRYYLQGLDVGDEHLQHRERVLRQSRRGATDRSPTSARSEPSATENKIGRRRESQGASEELWGSEGIDKDTSPGWRVGHCMVASLPEALSACTIGRPSSSLGYMVGKGIERALTSLRHRSHFAI